MHNRGHPQSNLQRRSNPQPSSPFRLPNHEPFVLIHPHLYDVTHRGFWLQSIHGICEDRMLVEDELPPMLYEELDPAWWEGDVISDDHR
jgi:hypothetical protein